MGSLPLAFSVHHFINSVGADAGFAAIIGLAILILLYFAQARETANLRNHAYDAEQRIQDLEARVAQAGRVQAAQPHGSPAQPAQPAQARPAAARPVTAGVSAATGQVSAATPAVAAANPATARVVAAALPIAPAGVAAPALTAATKLIPTPVPAPAAAPPPDATVIGGAPTVTPPPGTVAAVASPATVAGGANGTSHEHASAAPEPVSAPTGSQTPPPRIQIRSAPTAPPPRRPPDRRRQQGSVTGKRIALALVGLLALAGVVALLLVLTSNNGSSPSSASRVHTTNAPGVKKKARGAAVAPSAVTVAVLNGTATSGLAHRVALKLSGAGYKEGTVATATDQTKTTTTVAYLPGFRRDALAVASSLKLPQSAVAPVDQPTQSVACPPPSACSANVVVTVGSDLATTQ
jgi:hypothetical protein